MISNILLGTNDIKKAEVFYNELLTFFDAEQTIKKDDAILWKSKDSSVGLAVCSPHNKLDASNGNGCMVGLTANSEEMVISIYETALRLGGSCAGAPGERKPGVFAAYFRDLDQHKFGVFYVSA